MSQVKLITAAEVISMAFEDANLDPGYIKDFIILACQQEYFFDDLGEDYYNELVGQYPSAFTATNQYIIDNYLKPSLAFFIKARVTPLIAVKLTSAGAVKNGTDYMTSASDADITRLTNIALNTGEHYRKEMLRYLRHKDHYQDYPTYNNDSSGRQVNGASPAFSLGMVIQKKNKVNDGRCPRCGYSDCSCKWQNNYQDL